MLNLGTFPSGRSIGQQPKFTFINHLKLKLMNSKFFTFINPLLKSLDNGSFFRKPFSWLYAAIAILNLILPLYIMVVAVQSNLFDAKAKYIVTFIFIWLAILFAGWLGFQLWWNRKAKLKKITTSDPDFIATPAFAHFIQTSGESLGLWVVIVGVCSALFSSLFLWADASDFNNFGGLPFIQAGLINLIIMPIYSFLIVVGSRFMAELYKAVVTIAINTKSTKKDPTDLDQTT